MKKSLFIVAEISGNHKQSLDRAFKLVDAAAKAGADAIKLQTFKPEGMTLNINKGEFVLKDKKINSSWRNKTLYEVFKIAQNFLRCIKMPYNCLNFLMFFLYVLYNYNYYRLKQFFLHLLKKIHN